MHLTMNSFGLIGVTCPATCPMAQGWLRVLIFSLALKSFSYVLRSCPVATYEYGSSV